MLELINNDDNDNEDMNAPDVPPSPNPNVHPTNHITPPPSSFGDGAPNVQPGVSYIFHLTINSML